MKNAYNYQYFMKNTYNFMDLHRNVKAFEKKRTVQKTARSIDTTTNCSLIIIQVAEC
jgi:translation elongation factor P/translation initiation factor 5A